MDDADEREAFLNAIFDAPEDDLPRLVFADWLDERGESDWAELIRCQCERLLTRGHDRERALVNQIYPNAATHETFERGFRQWRLIAISADTLSNPVAFRQVALRDHPEWYGAATLKICFFA